MSRNEEGTNSSALNVSKRSPITSVLNFDQSNTGNAADDIKKRLKGMFKKGRTATVFVNTSADGKNQF